MSLIDISIFLLCVLVLLLSTGVWIPFSLFGVGISALLFFTNRPVIGSLFSSVWTTSTSWTLIALPLFIWMGEILYRTRLSEDLFEGISPWLRKIPGGMVHTNVLGCTLFAAVSGSSVATLMTVGKMTLPELESRGYPNFMNIGTLAGASTLGLMIPPSLTMIVYGVVTNQSIAKLFMAGVLPGIVLAFLFMGYIFLWGIFSKFKEEKEEKVNFYEKIRRLKLLLPICLMIFLVIGSMYAGFATATEAAALGVTLSLMLSAAYGSLTFSAFKASLLGTVRTSCMICLILIAASYLTVAMAYTGIPVALAHWVASLGLSTTGLIIALLIVYIILGCFLDGISTIVLTMAVVQPLIIQHGISMIWFGIFLLVVVEMAQITPPVGFNLFVLKNVTGRSISYIAKATFPLFMLMIVMIFILLMVPGLATLLPGNMR